MTDEWEVCEHEWAEVRDSQFSNDKRTAVYCIHCKCPGDKKNETGEVYWPAT